MTDWLRIGDAEREQAAAALGEHFALGRLTMEEHSERLERVWSARTEADLVPLFRDLPPPYPAPAGRGGWSAPAPVAAGGRRTAGPGLLRHVPGPLLVVLAVVAVVAVLSHLPLLLLGVGIWWLCAAKQGSHRSSHTGHRHASWQEGPRSPWR